MSRPTLVALVAALGAALLLGLGIVITRGRPAPPAAKPADHETGTPSVLSRLVLRLMELLPGADDPKPRQPSPVVKLLHHPTEEPEPTPAAAVQVMPPPVPTPRLPVKRINTRTADEILRRLAKAPTADLDKSITRAESIEAAIASVGPAGADATPALLARRADLAGLPFRSGVAARLAAAAAQHLAKGSTALEKLRDTELAGALKRDEAWGRAERIPALMQVLMVRAESGRLALAGHVAGIMGKEASAALAQIAVYDPSPDVRREAITGLDGRPAAEYRADLERGLMSPWPAAAEHAAEALVALRRVEATPALIAAYEAPDPQAPYTKGAGPTRFVKELVAVSHRANCLMCHPASLTEADQPRAVVPSQEELMRVGMGYGFILPRASSPTKRTFVRADITYLKQDYSVILGGERHDLFVRERLSTPKDAAAALARRKKGRTAHQEAAAFALRELTGQDAGPGLENWWRFALPYRAASGG